MVVPYSLVTNDAKLVGGPLVTGRAFGEFLIDSFDQLISEAGLHPRMMTVRMHARILGHPGRIRGLHSFLRHIQDCDDVWICRRGTSLPTGVMSSLRGKSTSDREASEAKF